MKHFKNLTGLVAATLLTAVMSFSASVNAATLVWNADNTQVTGISGIEVDGYGAYDATFSNTWPGHIYSQDFAVSASTALLGLFTPSGALHQSSLDFLPDTAEGCTTSSTSANPSGSCLFLTPWLEVNPADIFNSDDDIYYLTAAVLNDWESYQHLGELDYLTSSAAKIQLTFPDRTNVTWTELSAVPIPAAVFMFAPALLGFLGFCRKQRA